MDFGSLINFPWNNLEDALWEPALTNKFIVYLTPNDLGIEKAGFDTPTYLVLTARSVSSIPNTEVGNVTDSFFQFRWQYHNAQTAGNTTAGNFNISFRGFMDPADPAYIFYLWCRKAVETIPESPASVITGDRSAYKLPSAYLIMLTHSLVPWRVIEFKNVWVGSINTLPDLSYDSSSLIAYTAQMRYDYFKVLGEFPTGS